MTSNNLNRKQLIASALSKHFSLDIKSISDDYKECDIKGFCSNMLKAMSNRAPSTSVNNDEVTKWILFADSFPVDSKACFEVLKQLNEELVLKSVLLGNGFKHSEADIIIGLSEADKEKLPHVMRWMDYIQYKVDFGELSEKILLEKPEFKPPLQGPRIVANANGDSNAKNSLQSTKPGDSNGKKSTETAKISDKPEANLDLKKNDAGKKTKGDKEARQEKKIPSETGTAEKDKELSVSSLNIQVGLIRKAWKHPSADSLLVEEFDVGDDKLRQVVSGLAKYCTPEELTNRRVALITNVKPGKLRDVMSEGLVLCASNEDHIKVEPLLPPEGAKIGERVSFSGIDGKPEDVLNPKKKQLEKITLHLFTDDKGVATFKGIHS